MSEEPAAAADVRAALERTVSQGTARIEFRCELPFDFDALKAPKTRRPDGHPLRGLIRRLGVALIGVVLAGAMRLVERWWRKNAEQPAAGVIDFEAQRCMYADPSRSTVTLVVGDRTWRGPSGTAVDAVSADYASTMQPLWVIDLAVSVTPKRAAEPRASRSTPLRST